MMHPRDRTPWNHRAGRRDFLRWAAGTTLGGAILAACGDSSSGTGSAARVRVGTPENPIRQPLFDDNPPIESGLEPEDGPLRIYNWADYIWTRVVKDFEKEFDRKVEITTFYNLEEATRKLRTGQVSFDVFVPTAEIIPKLVAGKILQPLNHDYLPSLSENVWPSLQDPHYDLGSFYTVPYVVYTTGIGWRVDLVPDDIASMENPWEALWNPAYKDMVGLYDDYRETIGVGLYKNGLTDINTGDPDEIERAKRSLIDLIDLVNVRYTIDGAYAKLPEGKFGIHHAWAGDLVNARFYTPEDQDPSVLRYLWPPKGQNSTTGGYISNDTLGVLRDAEHPVLAHMFLDYMLQEKPALKNFSWMGYQPPQTALDTSTLVEDGWIPEYLSDAVITKDDFRVGEIPVQLTAQQDRLWLNAWSDVKAGGA
jgi:spermidine/putrescine transport system substrate-binding protein